MWRGIFKEEAASNDWTRFGYEATGGQASVENGETA
jgi:hypothetical protein